MQRCLCLHPGCLRCVGRGLSWPNMLDAHLSLLLAGAVHRSHVSAVCSFHPTRAFLVSSLQPGLEARKVYFPDAPAGDRAYRRHGRCPGDRKEGGAIPGQGTVALQAAVVTAVVTAGTPRGVVLSSCSSKWELGGCPYCPLASPVLPTPLSTMLCSKFLLLEIPTEASPPN